MRSLVMVPAITLAVAEAIVMVAFTCFGWLMLVRQHEHLEQGAPA